MKMFVFYLLCGVSVVALALGILLLGYTKIDPWTPLIVSLGAVAVLWPLLRKAWLRAGIWFGVAAHVFVVGSIAFALFLGLNAAFPKTSSQAVTGTVVKKYTKEHERRGGYRNRVVRGKYLTYHVEVITPDSMSVTKSVSLENYNRIKIGSKLPMEVETGLFGYEVMYFSRNK